MAGSKKHLIDYSITNVRSMVAIAKIKAAQATADTASRKYVSVYLSPDTFRQIKDEIDNLLGWNHRQRPLAFHYHTLGASFLLDFQTYVTLKIK